MRVGSSGSPVRPPAQMRTQRYFGGRPAIASRERNA
jgi:hypothetical protein